MSSLLGVIFFNLLPCLGATPVPYYKIRDISGNCSANSLLARIFIGQLLGEQILKCCPLFGQPHHQHYIIADISANYE